MWSGIHALGVPVVQINTDGACHLDATTIRRGFPGYFELPKIDALMIENVGNLVSTAWFRSGGTPPRGQLQRTEGHDKLIKYPVIFQRSHAMVITKTDPLPYTNFNVEEAIEGMKPGLCQAPVFQASRALRATACGIC